MRGYLISRYCSDGARNVSLLLSYRTFCYGWNSTFIIQTYSTILNLIYLFAGKKKAECDCNSSFGRCLSSGRPLVGCF